MRERAMQALDLLALDPSAETLADPNSYGFRTHRAPADAIAQCVTVLAKQASPHWVLAGDIRACFDEFSHDWLLAHIPMDNAILSKWVKAGDVEGNILHPTEAGTPQGGIGSPVVAKLALDGRDARLRTAFPRYVWKGGKRTCPKVNVIRLAADFGLTGATRARLEDEVKPWVEAFLKERGLPRSPETTVLTHMADGFDFLGHNIRPYTAKLLIKPSAQRIKTVLRNVRPVIQGTQSAAAGSLIRQLNPLIRGWAMDHRHAVSAKIFHSVDQAIDHTLGRWAKRRHPHQGGRWVKARDCHPIGARNWVFSGKARGPKGPLRAVHLFTAPSLPITRHPKITGAANPSDPQGERYCEKRLARKRAASLKGRSTLLGLWKRQDGRCPHGGEARTTLTGWHSHHKVWRSHGGSDTADHRVL